VTRVPVTETVVEQLRAVLDSGRLDDPHNWMAAQFAAQDLGHEELATFVFEADAATYYEAVERAQKDDT
jgi:hypothetical protein